MTLIDLTPTPEEELHLMEMLQPDYRLSNDSRVIIATESEKIPNQKEDL
tara:strand:+ start:332 stop:478 length:147 start_codon:yes stop_codon:yes gene_type:complete